MKTLREDLAALAVLHQVDVRIERARATLAGLDTGATLAADFSSLKPAADAARAEANRLAALQRDAELKLGSVETQIASANRLLYGGTVVVPKELENLQKKIEELGRRKDAAELAVLEAMETAQAADAEAAIHEGGLADLARRYRKVKAAWQERSDALKAEMESLAPPRADALAAVERADLLSRYEAIRGRKGGLGAAMLEADGSCSICHTKVNATLVDATKAAASVQACEHCGRLLLPAPPV